MKHTLIWNGISAEDMGVKIISLPPISLSTEKINEIETEGRDGTLTESLGFAADEKIVEADYRGNKPLEVARWLKGNGKVIFGNMPDRFCKARINNVVPLEQVLENQLYNFQVNFKCQPFSYLKNGLKKLNVTNGEAIMNFGTYYSLPKIFVTGNGTLKINNASYVIKKSMIIDSFLEEVLDGNGEFFEADEFPILNVGKNIISWTGNISKVEIMPNWRCI